MAHYPELSAIICTYNRAHLLPRTIDSILAQRGYDDFEIIIVHDGPPDDATLAVYERYAEGFDETGWGRVRQRPSIPILIFNTDERSHYYCRPRNCALEFARGDYIWNVDDDNFLVEDAFATLMDAMKEGVVWPDFAYGRINYVLEPGVAKVTPQGQTLPEGPAPFQPWDEMAMARLAAGPMTNFIDMSSFVAAKGAYWRLFKATGMAFNEEKRRYGDWELVTRAVFFPELLPVMAKYGGWRGKGVDHVVLNYTWNGDQIQLTRAANEEVRGVAL